MLAPLLTRPTWSCTLAASRGSREMGCSRCHRDGDRLPMLSVDSISRGECWSPALNAATRSHSTRLACGLCLPVVGARPFVFPALCVVVCRGVAAARRGCHHGARRWCLVRPCRPVGALLIRRPGCRVPGLPPLRFTSRREGGTPGYDFMQTRMHWVLPGIHNDK